MYSKSSNDNKSINKRERDYESSEIVVLFLLLFNYLTFSLIVHECIPVKSYNVFLGETLMRTWCVHWVASALK